MTSVYGQLIASKNKWVCVQNYQAWSLKELSANLHKLNLLKLILFIFCLLYFRFMVTSFYTKYDGIHFVFNSLSLLGLSLVPKFPQMYKVRLFGLNKYWMPTPQIIWSLLADEALDKALGNQLLVNFPFLEISKDITWWLQSFKSWQENYWIKHSRHIILR